MTRPIHALGRNVSGELLRWVLSMTLVVGALSALNVQSAQAAASATTTVVTSSASEPEVGDSVLFTVTVTPAVFDLTVPMTGNIVVSERRGSAGYSSLCSTSTILVDINTHSYVASCAWIAKIGYENLGARFNGDSHYLQSVAATFPTLNVIGVTDLSIPRIEPGNNMTISSWANRDGVFTFKANGIVISGCDSKSGLTGTQVDCTYSFPSASTASEATKIFSVDFKPTGKPLIVDAWVKSYTPDSYYLPNGQNIYQSTIGDFANVSSKTPYVNAGYVEVNHVFYKLNRSNLEAMVVGYDRFSGISELVLPDLLQVSTDVVPVNKPLFAGTYSITSIGAWAFDIFLQSPTTGATLLRKITLPQTLKVIGENAFSSQCGLGNIDIPDSVIFIGANAFSAMNLTGGINTQGYRLCASAYSVSSSEYPYSSSVANNSHVTFGGHVYSTKQSIGVSSVWSSANTYSSGNFVRNLSTRYVAVANVPSGTAITDTNFWQDVSPSNSTYWLDLGAQAPITGLQNIKFGSGLSAFGTYPFNGDANLLSFQLRSSPSDLKTLVSYLNSDWEKWQFTGAGGSLFHEITDRSRNGCNELFVYAGNLQLSILASQSIDWQYWAQGCLTGTLTLQPTLFTPSRPPIPTTENATLTSMTVRLGAPASDGGTSIQAYSIQYSSNDWSSWETATSTLSSAGTPFIVTGLMPSTNYKFRSIAVNSVGASIPSQTTGIARTLSPSRPSAPTIGVASLIDSRTASISFSAPADNGGSVITSYTVTSYPNRRTGTGSTSPIRVTGLTLNSPETFTVTATNIVGTSDSSTATNLLTPKDVFGVSFDSQGGSSITSGSFVSGESVTAPASSPTRSGYTFNGWFVVSSGGTKVTFPYSPGVTNNITLFAQWTLVPVVSTTPAPVVLGPPPSTIVVVAIPKISRSDTSFVCTSGTYKFKKQGGPEEASKISTQLISLLSNGAVVDSEKTLESQAKFESKDSYKGTTLSCEAGIKQEEVVKTFSSLDKEAISNLDAVMTAAIYGANTTYYSERDAAYLKRDSGDIKMWKEMLDKAQVKREDTKVQAGVDYLANLEKAGISLVVAADKAIPGPTPTPTPTPTKSPEVSVTGNVQPAEMKKVGTIYFASGTYFLNEESKKTIKALATSIFLKAPATVLSYGFTDNKGGTDNTLLSQNRAKVVAKLLRGLLPGQKIVTGWYASSKPVATGTSKAALAKNRRVEIYIK